MIGKLQDEVGCHLHQRAGIGLFSRQHLRHQRTRHAIKYGPAYGFRADCRRLRVSVFCNHRNRPRREATACAPRGVSIAYGNGGNTMRHLETRKSPSWTRILMMTSALALMAASPAITSPAFADEAAAKDNRGGLWKGCFVAPEEFRHDNKAAVLLGSACPSDKDRELRESLFPEEPSMPPGCSIKGKFATRARFTGDVGIYHLRGCPSYPALTRPDRWFCSEDDARAAGFRRAYNCRPSASDQ